MEELKKCPFCDGEAEIVTESNHASFIRRKRRCCRTYSFESPEVAIEAWNRRAWKNEGILFKAKRIDNGEWVEGYYWSNLFGNHFIRIAQDKTGKFVIEDFEIDPDTLCQYTGLSDKNGRKIFDRDVLFWEGVYKFYNGEDKPHTYQREKCVSYVYWSRWYMGWKVKHLVSDSTSLRFVGEENSIVIGNYYDNQDLIKSIEDTYRMDKLIRDIH